MIVEIDGNYEEVLNPKIVESAEIWDGYSDDKIELILPRIAYELRFQSGYFVIGTNAYSDVIEDESDFEVAIPLKVLIQENGLLGEWNHPEDRKEERDDLIQYLNECIEIVKNRTKDL